MEILVGRDVVHDLECAVKNMFEGNVGMPVHDVIDGLGDLALNVAEGMIGTATDILNIVVRETSNGSTTGLLVAISPSIGGCGRSLAGPAQVERQPG